MVNDHDAITDFERFTRTACPSDSEHVLRGRYQCGDDIVPVRTRQRGIVRDNVICDRGYARQTAVAAARFSVTRDPHPKNRLPDPPVAPATDSGRPPPP